VPRYHVADTIREPAVKLRLSPDLNAEVGRMAGRRISKSAWIEEAIRQRVSRETTDIAGFASDLPLAARERIEAYAALVRSAVRDEELAQLEEAWRREEDPSYYDLHTYMPSTLDACVDAMVGRGRSGRVPAAPGCM
jgi:predicted transcriptional regulator